MKSLEGKTLCKRQKNLNLIVKEAAEQKVSLQQVFFPESPDIDRIFKIDLASKYKNMDYIIEELKSGDSLYISRALKCEWIYDEEFIHIINPDYLHHHVFPKMSLKMKNKTLSTVSIYVTDESRAENFFEYCTGNNMENLASKFLILTSKSFKKKYLENTDKFHSLWHKTDIKYYRNLLGDSFELADIYAKRAKLFPALSYLYSVDNIKFLDLFEKHTENYYRESPVGFKMSHSLLKKHKDRILRNPLMYLSILNKSALIKYSSSEDAKVYAVALLPETKCMFWNMNYCREYKHIINLVKSENKYQFVKTIFSNKYPDEPFEMTPEFYQLELYDMMAFAEREAWALNHLEKQVGVISEEEDYLWYQFVSFHKTLEEIKKRILLVTKSDKRLALLKVLVKSAITQRELEELFNYFYKRHVNENQGVRASFSADVIRYHNVYEFDEACWNAFDRILHTLEIYSYMYPPHPNQVIYVSLAYYIVNNKPLPDDLHKFVVHIFFNSLMECLSSLNDEKKDLVFKFIYQFCLDKLTEFETKEYNDETKRLIRPYLCKLLEYLHPERRMFFSKRKFHVAYPDIVAKYLKLDEEQFKNSIFDLSNLNTHETKEEERITEGFLMRCLKENTALILDKLPLLKDTLARNSEFRMNIFLKKLKVYFSNDISKQFLDSCKTDLYNMSAGTNGSYLIDAIVFAIFQVGDETLKIEIMDKYAPTEPKIDHRKIGENMLRTQEAICRFHCYSRPPVPLSKTALYIKGDYVHRCKGIFNMYLRNLPPVLCSEFIRLLIDAPLSIQKRGLRLAFETYGSKDLIDLVKKVWKRTKNVSLRKLLYVNIREKVSITEEKAQKEFYELLIELTKDLNQNDDDEIFKDIRYCEIPEHLKGSYLQTVWETVTALPEIKSTRDRKKLITSAMERNISLMNEDFLVRLIYDHIHEIISDQKLRPDITPGMQALNNATWDLVVSYIIDIPNEDKLEKSLSVVKRIVRECFNIWDETYNTGEFVVQSFFAHIGDDIQNKTSYVGTQHSRIVHIYKYLLESFGEKFKLPEMYSFFWDWNLSIMTRTVIDGKTELDKEVHMAFGLQLGAFIREIKGRNQYYPSCFTLITNKLLKFTDILTNARKPELDPMDVSILIAYGLCRSDLFEAFVLAVHILPSDLSLRPATENELVELIKKLRQQNNDEIICLIHEKFFFSDWKVRKILL